MPARSKKKRRDSAPQPIAFRCTVLLLPGHRFAEIMPQARTFFRAIQKRTKRRAYVRSAYFQKEKIFFDYFWEHLQRKSLPDRARRLRYLPCALELIRQTRHDPITFIDPRQPQLIKHRFLGITPSDGHFSVIILQDRKSGKKQLLSCYPDRSQA